MNTHQRAFDARDFAGAFSAEEFMRLIEEGAFSDFKVELIDGEICKVAPAGFEHGTSNFSIAARLADAYSGKQIAIAIDLAIKSGAKTVRGADIAIVRADAPRRGAVEGRHVVLLVEIADTTLARDLGVKAAEYAAAGVPDYWVVDLGARIVHTMTAPAGIDGYAGRGAYRFGEAIPVPQTERTITID